jgi:hypothetical protein
MAEYPGLRRATRKISIGWLPKLAAGDVRSREQVMYVDGVAKVRQKISRKASLWLSRAVRRFKLRLRCANCISIDVDWRSL